MAKSETTKRGKFRPCLCCHYLAVPEILITCELCGWQHIPFDTSRIDWHSQANNCTLRQAQIRYAYGRVDDEKKDKYEWANLPDNPTIKDSTLRLRPFAYMEIIWMAANEWCLRKIGSPYGRRTPWEISNDKVISPVISIPGTFNVDRVIDKVFAKAGCRLHPAGNQWIHDGREWNYGERLLALPHPDINPVDPASDSTYNLFIPSLDRALAEIFDKMSFFLELKGLPDVPEEGSVLFHDFELPRYPQWPD